jgi:hypothetical protein
MLYTRGLPLSSRSLLAGRRLASLPRTPVAGVLSKDPRATAAISRAAAQVIERIPAFAFSLKAPQPDLDGLMEVLTAAPWRMSYVLQLPTEGHYRVPDSHSRNSIKWAINKATRLGVTVRPCSRKTSSSFGPTTPHIGPACSWTFGALKPCAAVSSP